MPQFNFQAIGTHWQIDIYSELSETEKANLFSEIKRRIDIFDKNYSRFRGDSLVTKISKETGVFVLPDDAKEMLELYRDLYLRTNGLVTPLIGKLISDAGYDATYSLQQKRELEKAPEWDEIIEYKHPNLLVKKPVLLDFGAAGKGYLIDLVAEVIEKQRVFEYCIDAGGDILHKNNSALQVGLENPENTKQVIGVFDLQNQSLCGSAGNRRKWGNFTHIINPKSMTSPTGILAVWVSAKTALVADALATCLFFISPSALLDRYEFDYLILHNDHSIEKSKKFNATLFAK